MNTNVLQSENILMEEQCVVCWENFINVNSDNYYEWLEYMKNKYEHLTSSNTFEDETCLLCYDDKFKCNTCNNLVCRKCVWNTHQGIVSAKFHNLDGHLEQSGIRNLTDDEIIYIQNKGYDIRNIVDSENYKEIDKIPHIIINNVRLYGYMRGTPGEDGPIKCPICRQLDNV